VIGRSAIGPKAGQRRALITCQDASFAYDGKVCLSGLDFSVGSGDYLCVVGENGSGKSTLLKGLLRLASPWQGSVMLGDGLLQSDIGYLPQQTAAQRDFPASAYEVVLSGRLGTRGMRPFYSKQDKAIVEENIERFGLGPLRRRCYRELSGGQQQRVLLARALSATRRMLLLDEPAAGLDPMATHQLYHIIESLNNEGLAIVMVSHDIHCAVSYASHILHLANRQVFFGPTDGYVISEAARALLGGDGHA
jgi:zinc transport system ATP-binding protein